MSLDGSEIGLVPEVSELPRDRVRENHSGRAGLAGQQIQTEERKVCHAGEA